MSTQVRLHDTARPGRICTDDKFVDRYANLFHGLCHSLTASLKALVSGVVVGAHDSGRFWDLAGVDLVNYILPKLEAGEMFIAPHISEIVNPLVGGSWIGNIEGDDRDAILDRFIQDRLKCFDYSG